MNALATRMAVGMGMVLAVNAIDGVSAERSRNVAAYRVVADGIPTSLSSTPGDAQRGRSLIAARTDANCVLCHAIPGTSERFFGDLGPSLDGVGRRLTVAQLRLRVVDVLRVNPHSAMPSYHRVEGLANVASRHAGTPILTAQEVEDVVAYLATLQ